MIFDHFHLAALQAAGIQISFTCTAGSLTDRSWKVGRHLVVLLPRCCCASIQLADACDAPGSETSIPATLMVPALGRVLRHLGCRSIVCNRIRLVKGGGGQVDTVSRSAFLVSNYEAVAVGGQAHSAALLVLLPFNLQPCRSPFITFSDLSVPRYVPALQPAAAAGSLVLRFFIGCTAMELLMCLGLYLDITKADENGWHQRCAAPLVARILAAVLLRPANVDWNIFKESRLT